MERLRHIGLVVLVLLLPAFAAGAQVRRTVLSGYVRDAAGGGPLVGAVVYTEDRKYGVATDQVGFYSLTVETGKRTILCAYTGYGTRQVELDLSAPFRHDFTLEEDKAELEAATVFSRSRREEIRLPQMGRERVDAVLVRKLPALMGEADIIRVIQMMPGVQAPSEGATGFSVRGGGVDQNLILMDGAPVYNCGHFLGFLSMFNGDAIRSADLYKGDFPAQYGGRLSSVLDVGTRDGNYRTFGGNASIGLITSKVLVEGPVIPQRLSFLAAARRTYMDVFFPLFGSRLPDNTAMYFYDVNAKLSWVAGPRDRLYLGAFSGRDVFGLSMDEFDMGEMRFGFANHTQSLRWNHVWAPKLTSDVTLYHSLYRNTLGGQVSEASFDYLQSIREAGLKAGWTWYPHPSHILRAGIQLAGFGIEPGECIPREGTTVVNAVRMAPTHAVQPSAYLQDEQKIGRMTLRYGVRFSSFTTLGETDQRFFDPETHELVKVVTYRRGEVIRTDCGWEPRLSLSCPVREDLSLKGSYARSYQYLQQARVSISGSPVDTWFTASPGVRPQVSDQYSLGFNALFADQAVELSLEGFYKDNRHTLDFVENAGIVIDNADREGLLRSGNSWSYGTELMLRYDFPRWSGWLAYTWSRAFYQIPEINGGAAYRSPLNHEHAVNFVLTCDISRRLSASAAWIFYSGAPTTYPVGRYYYLGSWSPVYSARNEDSLPDYHRMDLSLTYRTAARLVDRRWSGEWSLSLYNAYSRHNAWSIAFGYDRDKGRPQALKVYLFTIVPSLSYNIKF
ncbi:MAG: carboxypeptidase-like regulatory domain-containing protein [Bacteroidales bacterium]|nr:carboxypeptidase-like regulatory domain-containing protein [Bacteroidales bacterium]